MYNSYKHAGMSKPPCSDLTLPPKTSPPPPKLDPSWEVVCACSFGQEWTWGYLQPDAERLLSTLSR